MRSLERNLEKQDSHTVGDRKTREVIDSVETAVARDISENEVYSRHDNIPLRDSSEDTLIVPAKNNTENRWSDIIKVTLEFLFLKCKLTVYVFPGNKCLSGKEK